MDTKRLKQLGRGCALVLYTGLTLAVSIKVRTAFFIRCIIIFDSPPALSQKTYEALPPSARIAPPIDDIGMTFLGHTLKMEAFVRDEDGVGVMVLYFAEEEESSSPRRSSSAFLLLISSSAAARAASDFFSPCPQWRYGYSDGLPDCFSDIRSLWHDRYVP